jgi:hypothetical protein
MRCVCNASIICAVNVRKSVVPLGGIVDVFCQREATAINVGVIPIPNVIGIERAE